MEPTKVDEEQEQTNEDNQLGENQLEDNKPEDSQLEASEQPQQEDAQSGMRLGWDQERALLHYCTAFVILFSFSLDLVWLLLRSVRLGSSGGDHSCSDTDTWGSC
jgi:hypothetical protein